MDVVVTIDDKADTKVAFSVSYLDAPYMDNIFVVHPNETHRIAVLLLDITKQQNEQNDVYDVELEVLHFPANVVLPSDLPSAQEIRKVLSESESHESPSVLH